MVRSLLIRMTRSPAVRRTARSVKRGVRTWVLWPLNARRKARLTKLAPVPNGHPILARLELGHGCGCDHENRWIGMTEDALLPLRVRRRTPFSPTAMAIRLHQFADFTQWRKTVSRATDGKYHRSANKARRMGYVTRVVGLKSYERSLHALTGSKLRRSKGLFVWAALLGVRDDLVDTGAPPVPADCPEHWRRCWGVFRVEPSGERLAAFAILVRCGNVVWVQRFIGHGAALTDGVTKMLMFDIMDWLLARQDPETRGVDYLVHGYAEEGSIGLFDWKRYLGFEQVELHL
jgi:hypothetical protein